MLHTRVPCRVREAKDPRFESLSGSFEQGRFRKQYGFLYEEALPQQRLDLKAAARVSSPHHNKGRWRVIEFDLSQIYLVACWAPDI